MARWIVPTKGYDFDDERFIKRSIIKAGIDYMNDLKNEEERFLQDLQELDETKDSFMLTQYKIEINSIIYRNLKNNKLMQEFLRTKRRKIANLFDVLNNNNDDTSRLSEFYLYHKSLENSMKKFIRFISYTPLNKKGYIQLYQDLYHEIKMVLEWYYANDKSKIIQWKFYTNSDYTGKYIESYATKYNFIPIDTTEKPIRRAAAFITYLITEKTPDTKNSIPHNELHHIL